MASELGYAECVAGAHTPQTMKLIVSPSAAADLARLRTFLADKNPQAADRVAATLIAAVQSLDIFPERGRPLGASNVRELIVSSAAPAMCCDMLIGSKLTKLSCSASGTAARRANSPLSAAPADSEE